MRQRAPLPAVIAVSVAVFAGGVALAGPPEPAAVVGWPASTGLLVGEVVTGGASASDEFAEVYNASPTAHDLGGLELVYVTSTGGTVTRKATWSAGTMLQSGGHLLVANSSGIFASIADALYSSGFAATGGALVLRPIGGTPIDAVAWGDATNAFVEGTAAAAPPAGQSIERRPGGLAGNATDTNDNALDFFVNATPAAQDLAAPPVPAPQPTATPSASPSPAATATPSSTDTPLPTYTPPPTAGTPLPTESSPPTETPLSTGTPVPTADPTATAFATPTVSPTAAPTPTSTAGPTLTATPVVVSVAQARAAANGQVVDVIATLTTPGGLVESGTGAFIQDETGGIALYLASADWPAIDPGALVRVHGSVDDRYSQRTIRLGGPSDVTALGAGGLPIPVDTATGAAGEGLEGSVVAVVARVVAAADTLTDGFAVTVDDGSGPLRVVAGAVSGVVASDLPAQSWLRLSGPLGQRDTSGTGIQGYRLYLRSPLDIEAVPQPTPTPSPAASPTPSAPPTPAPTATPEAVSTSTPPATATPTASASPSPTPAPMPVVTIATARAMPLDSIVTVEGVATVEAGRIIDAASTVIQDTTAGIAVRLPAAGWPTFARGDLLRVRGVIGQRYGNLELRPASAASISVMGHGILTAPRPIAASELGEPIEGRLVRCAGVVASVDALGTTGNFGLDLKDGTGTIRVFVYGTTAIGRDAFPKGATVDVVGIEGQHAPSLGSTLGHRVWPRDRADVRVLVAATPSPGSTASPGASPSPGSRGHGPVAISTAIQLGGDVTIEGTVTSPPGFVDADGRRLVVEDDSGALLVRLPSDAVPPGIGTRIVASGTMGSYYGSPQLALSAAPGIGGTTALLARFLSGAPGPDLAWRLVRVSGPVASVHRLGTTWRAELTVAGQAVPIYGAARSGIASTALIEGRLATITGIVRPPYPTATDRRPAIAPRFAADVSLGGPAGSASASGTGSGGSDAVGSGVGGVGGSSAGSDSSAPLDLELGELADHEGVLVRVGGLVVSASTSRVVIDDGTATAALLLPADASSIAADLRAGDPLNAVGMVVADGAGWAVAPRSAADLARVGRLGELVPLGPVGSARPDSSEAAGSAPERLGTHGDWPVGAIPTLVALAGTAVTMAFRRREALELARKIGGLIGHLGR